MRLRLKNKTIKRIFIIDAVLMVVIILMFAFARTPVNATILDVESTYNSVELTWNEVDEAIGYRIYRSENGGDYKYITVLTETSFTDTDLSTGTEYSYLVKSYNALLKESDGVEVSVTPKLETPSVKINTDEGLMVLSISPVDGAEGYEIYRDDTLLDRVAVTNYTDKEVNGSHTYKVRAYRGTVYSSYCKVKGELISAGELSSEIKGDDIVITWTGNEVYKTYQLFNGNDLLTETSELTYTLCGFDPDAEYNLKLIGIGEKKSPASTESFRITEEKMTNKEAIEAAVEWAVTIANDDSFTYGVGQRAHRFGCYFCQTNIGPRKNIKGKSKVNGHSYEKTYCCNPFISAAYAHGAGDPALLKACQNGKGIGMTVKSFTRYGNWKKVGKPAKSKLQAGDVLVKSNHVAMYIGNGKLVEASGEGWGAGSIAVKSMSDSRYKGFSFVMRYTGTGRGVKYVIEEVKNDN